MENDLNSSHGIDDLIKNDGDLENILTSQLENLEKWRKFDLSLSHGDWSVGNNLRDITKENEHVSTKIKDVNDAYEDCNEKFKSTKSQKSKKIQKIWLRFVEDSQYYRNLLISAQEEYRSDNLISDTRSYNAILEEINCRNQNHFKEMDELTAKFGLVELGTNVMARRLNEIKLFINSLQKDQLPMSIITRSYENDINNIKNKIRQKDREIIYLINKKK